MPTLRLHDTDRYEDATLTASSEATALPVEASQDPDRSYVWRSATDTTVQTIDIDLGSVLAVDSVAVANVVLLGSGDLELYERGDAGSPGAATLVATLPAQDAERRTAVSYFTEQSHRHWQLNWSNPGSDSGAAELGFCALGTYTTLTHGLAMPVDMIEVDPSVTRLSVDRQRRTVTRTRYLAGSYLWRYLTEAERTSVETVFRSFGIRRPLYVTIDEGLAWTTILSYIVSGLTIQRTELDGRYTLGVDWEEAT